ncbi:DUF4229 domain-containing protein [Spongiactinospora rosea]|uniref:DUF4229 domain-containing protein n=1 Tax=Spongiactinospora rosea TaxID=2248750 RepID=A0A366M7C3_9ACTN|nr:DUF4229 domain-containing protein [Spongiactinospora rosea]
MRALLVYTASRLGLFAVAFCVLYLLGLRSWPLLLIISFVLSGLASYILLSGQRDAVSARLTKEGTSRPAHGTPGQDGSYRSRPADREDAEETP